MRYNLATIQHTVNGFHQNIQETTDADLTCMHLLQFFL